MFSVEIVKISGEKWTLAKVAVLGMTERMHTSGLSDHSVTGVNKTRSCKSTKKNKKRISEVLYIVSSS